jgi:enolase-phosphatase E1
MIRIILTDIEGTTSSIAFVKDVLFPYAAAALPEFLVNHQKKPDVQVQLEAVRSLLNNQTASLETVTNQLLTWIADDQKVTPLKTLQGMIWEQGYRSGIYTGHLYPDAYDRLQQWHGEGLKLYLYSSGSIWAQKLFFGFSDYGDLTPWFTDFFDTTIGPKREAKSYGAIVAAIGCHADEILFLSDVAEELDAAKLVGVNTCQLLRVEDYGERRSSLAGRHRVVESFGELELGSVSQ